MKTFYSMILVALMATTGSVSAGEGRVKGRFSRAAAPPAISPRNEQELQDHSPTIVNKRVLLPAPMPPNGAGVSSIQVNGVPVPIGGPDGAIPVSTPQVDCSRYASQLATGFGGKGKGKGGGGSRYGANLQNIPANCLRQPGFAAASLGKGGKGGGGSRGGSRGKRKGRNTDEESSTTTRHNKKENAVESLLADARGSGSTSTTAGFYSMATATVVAAGVALFAML